MKAIAFTPDRNIRRRDYTGAFRPCAQAWAARFGAELHALDVTQSPAAMRRETLRVLDRAAAGGPGTLPLRVAFFCHGTPLGIQLGWDLAGAGELARALAWARPGAIWVSIFSCSTGAGPGPGGDGGFADALRDAMCSEGIVGGSILAHARSGHAARCPYKRRFAGTGSRAGGQGGTWLVRPNSPLWAAWRRAMREGSFWQEVGELSVAQIHDRLVIGAAS